MTKERKPLPIGVSDFKKVASRYYYVDKTDLIKDIIDDLPKVSLFTRPRCFGKTLTMDMLRVFFEKTDEDTSNYFRDKIIWTYGEKYTKYQGQYPVIYLSFKDVEFNSWSDTIEKLKLLFQSEFVRHKKIIENDSVADRNEIDYFEKVINGIETEVELTQALGVLSKMLHDYYSVAPIIIIDDYDIPIQQGYVKKYYDEVVSFMWNLFSGGFKDNSYLSFGFLTGMLRVAKESDFLGMNNLTDNSILKDRYSAYFGFTKEETREMLEYYGKRNKYNEVCECYGGYKFGSKEIFNPWSVLCYMNNNCVPQIYWSKIGVNDIIHQILQEAPLETIIKMNSVLEGKALLVDVDTAVDYLGINDNPQSFFSFLLIAGYLKVIRSTDIVGTSFYYISIPNAEIKQILWMETYF